MATSKIVIRDGDACHITLPLNPVPAARPRVGKYGTFYPKNYANWRSEAKALLAPYSLKQPYTYECAVHVEFIIKSPANPSNPYPRGDIDNYVKSILDAMTTAQVYWKDDISISELYAYKRYAKKGEAPCVNLSVWKHPPASGNGCGKPSGMKVRPTDTKSAEPSSNSKKPSTPSMSRKRTPTKSPRK